jgi:hypothetical protein
MTRGRGTAEEFRKIVRLCPKYLGALKSCDLIPAASSREIPAVGGVYVIFENRKPMYTGRSRNIRRRISNHRYPRPGVSAFSMKLARELSRKKATYTKVDSFNSLKNDQKFLRAYDKCAARISRMSVKFVEIENEKAQYLFELYASMMLATPYNDFNTH